MKIRVLIIGGYGNFGRFIAQQLAGQSNVQLILAGRSLPKARQAAQALRATHPVEAVSLDIYRNLPDALALIKPNVVVHTSGPYQGQGYGVAQACINHGCHYLDLADAREFVVGVTQLDQQAKANKVLICSGASSVPCLTASIIDHHLNEFRTLDTVEYAIATAQLTNRGLATIRAVLSYAGKPFTTLVDGKMQAVYGWLGLSWRRFWKLNLRALGNCDVPDLTLFPKRYPGLKTLRFRAGIELKLLHLVLFGLSALVRIGLIPTIQPMSALLLKISFLFDPFGKDDSGFYMKMSGIDQSGMRKHIQFDLVARHGDGLCIPSLPAIIMVKKIANGEISKTGATPCLDLITMSEYLDHMKSFDIQWQIRRLSPED